MKLGYILGLDSWSETVCSVKHAYVDEFGEGNSVNVTGFTSNLVSIDKFPIAHILCVFDKEDATVVFLEQNNTICMGDDMVDSLSNPIQYKDNYVRVDLRPKI